MTQVLIVDDDADIRFTLKTLLVEEHYQTAEAADGMAALAILQQATQPFVVLLDLTMPRLDGYGVLEQVQAQPLLATTHVFIVMTAKERTFPLALVQKMRQLHISFLGKPFDNIDQVIAAVADAESRLGPP
jgi:CheY-like chemotaxis protein